jgi:CHASE2 domain-containing sensor protein
VLMRRLYNMLGGLLVVCFALRAAAWLVTPAIPAIAMLLVVIAALLLVVGQRDRL